jgi:hypothetical protein
MEVSARMKKRILFASAIVLAVFTAALAGAA